MTLSLSATVAARGLDVEMEVAQGERVAILGPNGAGKSTLLAVLAGILRPDTGRAVLHGRVLYDRTPGRHAWVPPHTRGIALLAQDALLFPHMSALDNVAFGPRSRGEGPRRARLTAGRWLEEVGASELATRRPAQLSGGQAQRVAIARALAADPLLLLLDEPMAALDVAAAPLLRRVLRPVLAERSALIVTHDLLDAVLLATRVIVIDDGRIVEDGPTHQVIEHPRTPFTARIAGLNLVEGRATGPTHLLDRHGVHVEGIPNVVMVPGDAALAVFSPNAVSVHLTPPAGSARNSFRVVVTELEPRDAQVRVRSQDPSGRTLLADVTAASIAELDLYPGRHVHYAVKATAVTIYAE